MVFLVWVSVVLLKKYVDPLLAAAQALINSGTHTKLNTSKECYNVNISVFDCIEPKTSNNFNLSDFKNRNSGTPERSFVLRELRPLS